MGIGLSCMLCHQPLDPLSDLGDVVGFLKTMCVSLPGLGKLPLDQLHHIAREMRPRVVDHSRRQMAGPGECLLLSGIPSSLEQGRFALSLVVGHGTKLLVITW